MLTIKEKEKNSEHWTNYQLRMKFSFYRVYIPWTEWQFRWWECTIPCRSMKGQHQQWIGRRASQNRQEWCHSKVNDWWMAKDLLHCPQAPSPASNHIHLCNFEWVLAFASTMHRAWNNHWHQTNAKSLQLTTPQMINSPWKVVDSWLSQFLDKRLCRFCSNNVVENEAQFVLDCPLYNSIT